MIGKKESALHNVTSGRRAQSAKIIAFLVLVFGFATWVIYSETRPVGGTIISTTYEPKQMNTSDFGSGAVLISYTEAWFAKIDTDGDMKSDRIVKITQEEFAHLEDGDSFTQ